MRVGITTIAYNQPEDLLKMAETAVATSIHDIEFHLFLHSKSAKTEEACQHMWRKYNTAYYPLRTNAGVAKSWNSGILSMIDAGCEALMICNDDIWFTQGDIDEMVRVATANEDSWAVFCSGWHDGLKHAVRDHGMACFILNAIAIEKIGMFDQNFFPAYNEDLDYARRAELLGLSKLVANTMVHHKGSATIQASPQLRAQNHQTHGKNDEYWEGKWGAKKPKAVYKYPFGKKELGLYISPENRHAPYPGFNRSDKGIVRF